MRPTWTEISLSALRANFKSLRERLGPEVDICTVVKADAYGHGAVRCSLALADAGATWFGVTNTEEGMHLRRGGVHGRIMLMTGFWHDEAAEVVDNDFTPAIWEPQQVERLQKAAVEAGKRVRVHLKFNTGMTRLGVDMHDAPAVLEALRRSDRVELEGVFTHLASSEVLDASSIQAQLCEFERALALVAEAGLTPKLVHTANTAAVLSRPHAWKTMVRPGLALYGYSLELLRKGQVTPAEWALTPALTWKTHILSLRRVPAGTAIGYGGAFITQRESLIAAVPLGYADGLNRALSCRGRMIVRGNYAPFAGNVAMDLTMLDVTDIEGVQPGDETIVIGRSGDCVINAFDHARLANTIPYEILCAISKRVPRKYVE